MSLTVSSNAAKLPAHSDSHDDVNRFDTTVLVREVFLESGVAKSLRDLIELGNLPPRLERNQMRHRIFTDGLTFTGVKKLFWQVALLWLCCDGQVLAAPLRLSYSVAGPSVAGVWMAQDRHV